MTLIMKVAGCFDSRFKFAVHVNQCVLVILGIILAIVALAIPGKTMTRALMMAIGMVNIWEAVSSLNRLPLTTESYE